VSRYWSPDAPAPSVDALLDQLREEHRDGFLYRGQTEVYPPPLIPSAYRRYRRNGATYTNESREFASALRKDGRHFVGLVPINHLADSFRLFSSSPEPPRRQEVELLARLVNDQYLARTLAGGTGALEAMLTPHEAMRFRDRFPLWKEVIDHYHRAEIRDLLFMRPFGYLLGQALAQQYGFSSEMLDVTGDPGVAGFFATHLRPKYLESPSDGVGMIYRFRPPLRREPLDLGAYNFYSCPAVLLLDELMARFVRDDAGDVEAIHRFLVESFERYHTWRRWDDFAIARTVLSATRIARQRAGFLVPDLIYEEFGEQPHAVRVRLAVEDIATRDGTEAFYFRHSPRSPALATREELWPNESDALFEMIGNALLISVLLDTGDILPSRIDLLDPGYDPRA